MRMRVLGSGLCAFALAVLVVSCAGTSDIDTTPTARTSVDAHVGKQLASDGQKVEDITDKFGPNETVFAVVDVPGKIEGTLRVRWLRGAEQVNEQSVALTSDVHYYSFQLVPPTTSGHPAGSYVLEVYVNDNKSESESFQVQ